MSSLEIFIQITFLTSPRCVRIRHACQTLFICGIILFLVSALCKSPRISLWLSLRPWGYESWWPAVRYMETTASKSLMQNVLVSGANVRRSLCFLCCICWHVGAFLVWSERFCTSLFKGLSRFFLWVILKQIFLWGSLWLLREHMLVLKWKEIQYFPSYFLSLSFIWT